MFKSCAVTEIFQTRYFPVSLTKSQFSSSLNTTPLAKLNPLATIRVVCAAGSYSKTRPVERCSRMSIRLAGKMPPHFLGAKRVEASVK
ncbi:MAG: hypothetical protein BWX55_01588 [Deltaproteobacteria bacterium ADurb.Bin022]|nr:MAG: hypothetical protein BWX55_01588 [Deltaproteobacteria bacterium ADurb.Bin022]